MSSDRTRSNSFPAPILIQATKGNSRVADLSPLCLEIQQCSVWLGSHQRKGTISTPSTAGTSGSRPGAPNVGIQPLETRPPESYALCFQLHAPSPKAHPRAHSHVPRQARLRGRGRISHCCRSSSPAKARAVHTGPLSSTAEENGNTTTSQGTRSPVPQPCHGHLG